MKLHQTERRERRISDWIGRGAVAASVALGLAAVVGGLQVMKSKERNARAQALLRKVGNTVAMRAADRGFPARLDGLIGEPRRGGPPLRARELDDPWGTRLRYTPPPPGSPAFVLCPAGPDREHGTDDDLCLDD